jgi:acyl-CoA dehydrogenase
MLEWIIDKIYQKNSANAPKISKTEQEALDAGDTWIEQSIFVGKPDWEQLAAIKNELSIEEESFIQNETRTLCDMLDEWQNHQHGDLTPEVWQFIKDNGFFGLVISKKYGGKGFSAQAHSDIIIKVASRSVGAAVTIMVPNSLGPGELITYYGTEKQKQYYLPRLASGVELPCFALTEPGAGSDATSIQAEAIVVKRDAVLGLEITANKRWITLAPIATLIGLAVVLKDPDNLLAGVGAEGITCVLMPRDTADLEIGDRHLPANQTFMNGTIKCNRAFIPIENIIGGQKNAGMGWQMLVQCL